MRKRERHRNDLTPLVEEALNTGDAAPLEQYVVAHSNLPGPRGNLELAQAFGDVIEALTLQDPDRVWRLCVQMADRSPRDAPVNAPKELIPFCGAVGVGAIGATCEERFAPALALLRTLAGDPRWRMREAVAFGLQRMLETRGVDTLETMEGWVAPSAWFAMRAAAAAVAHPAHLQDRLFARSALDLHQKILAHVLVAEDRRSEPFRVLRKGLAYTVSVVVQAVPEDGFRWMAELAESGDPDVVWILKQNLRKRRLTRYFAEDVAAIRGMLER